jgi:hypothetical protein
MNCTSSQWRLLLGYRSDKAGVAGEVAVDELVQDLFLVPGMLAMQHVDGLEDSYKSHNAALVISAQETSKPTLNQTGQLKIYSNVESGGRAWDCTFAVWWQLRGGQSGSPS